MRVLGIPIQIHRSWFIVVAFVSWTLATGYFPINHPALSPPACWGMGLAAALLLFVCVVLHELGHALMARAFGIPVAQVTLFLFGGVAWMLEESRRPAVELLVAVAGPLVSLLLAAACFWGAGAMPEATPWQIVVQAIVQYLAYVNTGILLFNLLPGLPLDGGRVLRALPWAVTRNARLATRVTSAIGRGLGMGLIVLGGWMALRGRLSGGLWYVLLGVFLRRAAQTSSRRVSDPTGS